MKVKILFLLLFSGFMTFLNAQEKSVQTSPPLEYGYELESISFFGQTGADYIPIKKDNGTGTFSTPQWLLGNTVEENHPIGYSSNSQISLLTKISTDCPSIVWMKAIAITESTTFNFPEKKIMPQGEIAVYQGVSEEKFPEGVVDYYDNDFEIKWFFTHDENGQAGSTWYKFDDSQHRVYVTHDFPINLEDVYETTIHIGCKEAEGKSHEGRIVGASFVPFDDLKAARKSDGKIFTYWDFDQCGDVGSACQNLAELLASSTADGRCGALSDLFIAIIETQGISEAKQAVLIPPQEFSNIKLEEDMASRFGPRTEKLDYYPYYNSIIMGVKNWSSQMANAQYNIFLIDNYGDCTPQWGKGDQGIAGHGNIEDPVSLHSNHALVEYKAKIYDPSYGYKQLNNQYKIYEDKSIDIVSGIVIATKEIIPNPNPNLPPSIVETPYFWIISKNTANTPQLSVIYD